MDIKKYLVRTLYALLILGVGWFVSVALERYKAGSADEGIFICNDDECFKTVHIHADIEFDLCGVTTIELPRETGDLSGLHTHKEKNYLHFHDRLELEHPKDGEVKTKTDDYTQEYDGRLTLDMIVETYELQPEKYCNTKEVITELEVNGNIYSDFENYNRIDGDHIKLIYREKE